MTTDKLFILLLVILLPLTGCLDIADTAEAEDSDEENTTTTMPMVHSLHIEANTNATIQFDGDTTMKVETIYRQGTGGQDYDRSVDTIYFFDMNCDNESIISSGGLADDEYLPVLAGQSCTVLIQMSQYGALIIFSEASLSAL
jgi:hypothetical protein